MEANNQGNNQWAKLNPVPFGNHGNTSGNCPICHYHVLGLCIECQAMALHDPEIKDNLICVVAYGVCNHAYHFHCIDQWLNYRPTCPLDNLLWTFK